MPDGTMLFFSPDGKVKEVPSSLADKALANGGERAIVFNAPNGKQKLVPQSKVKDALDNGGYVANASDLTVHTGEGVYKMVGQGGKAISVPYSLIGSASKIGYVMDPSERKRYTQDAAADPRLNSNQHLLPGVKAVGRNTAGQTVYAGESGTDQKTSASSRFLSSAGGAVSGAAKGLYHGIVEGPQNPHEAAMMGEGPGESPEWRDPILGRLTMVLDRLLVQPSVVQAQQAVDEMKKANAATPWYSFAPNGEAKEHRQLAAGHALAAAVPGVGPWAAQVGEQIGQQIGTGDVAGAAGTLAGNVAIYEAPHAIGKTAKFTFGVPKSTMDAVTETTPRDIREMAEKVAEENEAARKKAADDYAKAQETYKQKKAEAEHETRGREIGHKYDVKQKAKQGVENYRKEAADVAEHNARVWKKTSEAYKSELDKVRDDNKRVTDKYDAERSRIEDENKAAEHLLEMRRAEEDALEKETEEYYAKEDAEKAKAKDAENAAWEPWHKKMDEVPVDIGPVQAKLKPILDVSPEARRAMSQLTPDPADVEPDSLFAQDRKVVMAQQGYTGDYWDLPPDRRAIIDQITSSNGFQPEPIDLNPQGGGTIPLKIIQRAQSIIGRNIAKGRYEGPLLGEMKQIQAALRGVVTTESAAHGAASLLDSARKATIDYQEAFGRERPSPKTLDKIRQKGANPEEFKEREEEERLAGAAKLSPELVEAYKKVKARREALKAMKTEDQLRKSIQQVPPPPTVGDLRPGYNLKPNPVYQLPTVGDLRSGYALKPEPQMPAAGAAIEEVKQPERVPVPEEPSNEPPPQKTISGEDITKEKEKRIRAQARELRKTGLRRAMYATLTGLPFAVIELFTRAGATGAGEAAIGGLAAGGVVLAGSQIIANLVEKPAVKAWLSQITPKDAEMWSKLPPEQKALFTEDMKAILDAADKRKIPVSPIFRAFVSGTAGAQQTTPEELKQKAAQYWRQIQSQQATPTGGSSSPQPALYNPEPEPDAGAYTVGPQSINLPPSVTHVFDEKTGTIVAV